MNSALSLLVFGLLSLTFWSCNETKEGAPDSPLSKSKPVSITGTPPPQPDQRRTTKESKPHSQRTDTDRVIRRLDVEIESRTKRAIKHQNGLSWQAISAARLGKARLTGDVKEYVEAKKALDNAFKLAKPGTGPFLARAAYNLTIHKIGKVEEDLINFERKIIIKKNERATVAGLRGAVFFLQGDLDKALEKFKKADTLKATTSTAARIANYHLKTGAFQKAQNWYQTAIERVDKSDKNSHAWAELHLGIVSLEQNKVDAAERQYAIANETFTGWYLINEHIAEAAHLTRDYQAAIERYKTILEDTPNGEFYHAIGDAYLDAGKKEESAAAYVQAREAFERDIKILPSAASGHALDFFFEHAPVRALTLAKENFKLRPGHEARTQLAKAFMLNKLTKEAQDTLSPTLDSKWATHDFLVVAAVLFEKSKPKIAEKMKLRVEKIESNCVQEFKDSLPK